MVVGIGTDICDSRRIADSIARHPEKFIARIFTPGEIAAAGHKANPATFYAKRFAAKEAVYKALQPSGVAGRGWLDAEILNDEHGAPTITLSGACNRALEALTPSGYKANVNLSLSDELPYAIAFVVISVEPV